MLIDLHPHAVREVRRTRLGGEAVRLVIKASLVSQPQGRSVNEDERLAKQVVEQSLDGVRLEFRRQQHGDGRPRHDFWLHWPDKPRAGLEVTSVRDEDRVRTRSKIRKNQANLPAEKCDLTWSVRLEPAAIYSEVRERIDPCLALLEAEGIVHFRPTLQVRHRRMGHKLLELGVKSADAHPEADLDPPLILLQVASEGGFVSAQVVYDAVASVVPDNRAKLGELAVSECHLFVVLSSLEPAGVCIQMAEVDPRVPDLPDEITHLWAAGRILGDSGMCSVWRCSQGRPWRSVGPVSL